MKMCYQCLREEGLTVPQPQMLIAYRGCDQCGKYLPMSWSVAEVKNQMLNSL